MASNGSTSSSNDNPNLNPNPNPSLNPSLNPNPNPNVVDEIQLEGSVPVANAWTTSIEQIFIRVDAVLEPAPNGGDANGTHTTSEGGGQNDPVPNRPLTELSLSTMNLLSAGRPRSRTGESMIAHPGSPRLRARDSAMPVGANYPLQQQSLENPATIDNTMPVGTNGPPQRQPLGALATDHDADAHNILNGRNGNNSQG